MIIFVENRKREMQFNITRALAAMVGCVWAVLEPTVPFALIIVFATALDCVSAWRLNRRVKMAYPDGKRGKTANGKLESAKMMQMIGTLGTVYLVTLLAYMVDKICLPYVNLYLGQAIAGAYCLAQVVSILENESSCNGSRWATLAQKILADKTERHLHIDITHICEDDGKKKV